MSLQSAAQIESTWKESPRWKGVVRGYGGADVVRLRGTVQVEHSIARLGAEKLWRYLHELPGHAAGPRRPQGDLSLGLAGRG